MTGEDRSGGKSLLDILRNVVDDHVRTRKCCSANGPEAVRVPLEATQHWIPDERPDALNTMPADVLVDIIVSGVRDRTTR